MPIRAGSMPGSALTASRMAAPGTSQSGRIARSYSASPCPGPSTENVARPRSRNSRSVRAELLLGRVEAGDQDHHRVRARPRRAAQDPGQHGAVERDLDPLARRVEIRQRVGQAPDRRRMRRPQLRHVLDEHELREVVVDRRLREVGAGGPVPAVTERRPAESLVLGAGRGTRPRTSRPSASIADVTRAKSAGSTPLAMKRGAQWSIAIVTRRSAMPDSLAHDCSADTVPKRSC